MACVRLATGYRGCGKRLLEVWQEITGVWQEVIGGVARGYRGRGKRL